MGPVPHLPEPPPGCEVSSPDLSSSPHRTGTQGQTSRARPFMLRTRCFHRLGRTSRFPPPGRTRMEAKGPFKHALLPYSLRPALTSPVGAWPSEDPQNSSAGPFTYGSRERAKPTNKDRSPKQRHGGRGGGAGRPGPSSLLSCLQEAASRRTRLSPQIRTLVRTDWGRGKVGAEFSSVFLVFFFVCFYFCK